MGQLKPSECIFHMPMLKLGRKASHYFPDLCSPLGSERDFIDLSPFEGGREDIKRIKPNSVLLCKRDSGPLALSLVFVVLVICRRVHALGSLLLDEPEHVVVDGLHERFFQLYSVVFRENKDYVEEV